MWTYVLCSFLVSILYCVDSDPMGIYKTAIVHDSQVVDKLIRRIDRSKQYHSTARKRLMDQKGLDKVPGAQNKINTFSPFSTVLKGTKWLLFYLDLIQNDPSRPVLSRSYRLFTVYTPCVVLF